MNIKQYICNIRSLILAAISNERSIFLIMNPDKSYIKIEAYATTYIELSARKTSEDLSFLDTSIDTYTRIKIIKTEVFDLKSYIDYYHMKAMLKYYMKVMLR